MSQKITLGYWKIRGLAQPVRLLLAYAGADFNDVRYEQGDGPEYSAEEWTKVKFTLGLPFPNLPYLIDGDVKISQSNAILRYLGQKYNLLGDTPKTYADSEMMLENVMDLRNMVVRLVYMSGPNFETNFKDHFKAVPDTFQKFDDFLKGKEWFAGDSHPTICDFHAYEMLDQHRLMKPDSLSGYKNLNAFLDRFENLPKIKAYMESDKFIKRPVNNKVAAWK